MLSPLLSVQETEREPHVLDRLMHAWAARFTGGLSPGSLGLAYLDWLVHLSLHPGKQGQLVEKYFRKWARFGVYGLRSSTNPDEPPCVKPLAHDHRFSDENWDNWPFNIIYQGFLLSQQWWHVATTGVRGVQPHHEEVVNFVARQLLDIWSPSNFLPTNPDVLKQTFEEGGQNLWRGFENFMDDQQRKLFGEPPPGVEDWKVGDNLATTPGKVIYRNQLIELIQYEPSTKTTYPEPILFVPAWIMKYYILDLRPKKSLVEYLVDKGHTVFMISWKNPGTDERDLGMEDYRRLGVMAAMDAVSKVVPDQKIHAVGYCLGGTLLTLAAAAMARDGDDRLKSMTQFAAQTDFSEPGELDLFIDYSQVAWLEDVMWESGYLESRRMAGAFQLLRSQDLVWSRMVHDYLLGRRAKVIDLMAWNADATRMPYKMHGEYLRKLFLHNDLAEGRYDVEGQPIHIGDIRVPIFSVGTARDHIAPWRSVYKINRFARTDVSFLLTTGGHNAGIITPPGHPRRKYQLKHRKLRDPYTSAEQFHATAEYHQGSWWPEWEQWLRGLSGSRGNPPAMGNPEAGLAPLCDAPGEYVKII